MVGLGQSFKNSRLDPDGKILKPSHLCSCPPEVASAGFCVFSSDPDPHPESKFFEKPDPHLESVFNLGSSRSQNRSRILNFEKLPDVDSKILEHGRSLKK